MPLSRSSAPPDPACAEWLPEGADGVLGNVLPSIVAVGWGGAQLATRCGWQHLDPNKTSSAVRGSAAVHGAGKPNLSAQIGSNDA